MIEWRAVPGYEGAYEASSDGRIRSLDRIDHAGRRLRGVILKQVTRKDGYHGIYLCKEGRLKTFTVHKVIAATFIGPRPDGHCVCHNDGSRANNAASNLRYDTQSGNLRDTVLHGTSNRGRKRPDLAERNRQRVAA